MPPAELIISGFGDEIASEPDEQLAILAGLGIRWLDLRSAWDRNVVDFEANDLTRLRAALRGTDIQVSMVASPIGKSEIVRDAGEEEVRLEAALRMAGAVEAPYVRVFSFYHAGLERSACRDEVVRRLAGFAARAAERNVTLLLENEVGIWGDTPERCRDLLDAVGSPALRFTLDTGNFASVGIPPLDHAYPILRPYLAHVQVKDVRSVDGAVVLPGLGDGQIPPLLARLRADGYRGYVSLEPHLSHAGKLGGFSGPDLFSQAARALQAMLRDVTESPP